MLVAAGMLAVLSSLPSASAGTTHDDVPEVVVRDRTAEDVAADIAGTLDSAAAPIDGEFFVEAGEPLPMTYDEALVWQDDPDMDRADLTIATDEEVAAWGERIDAYLAGTELEGYGHLFARCAADYGVDPRLSPAISRKESGCGANCIADFNAWGWGGEGAWAEWGSWEEAIDGHVYGLAKGGYASMGPDECESYCDEEYWDGDPELNLRDEILKI